MNLFEEYIVVIFIVQVLGRCCSRRLCHHRFQHPLYRCFYLFSVSIFITDVVLYFEGYRLQRPLDHPGLDVGLHVRWYSERRRVSAIVLRHDPIPCHHVRYDLRAALVKHPSSPASKSYLCTFSVSTVLSRS